MQSTDRETNLSVSSPKSLSLTLNPLTAQKRPKSESNLVQSSKDINCRWAVKERQSGERLLIYCPSDSSNEQPVSRVTVSRRGKKWRNVVVVCS